MCIRDRTDQQRGIQIIQRLNDASVDNENKQVLKNLLGRIFGSVWKSVYPFSCLYNALQNLKIFSMLKQIESLRHL